MNNQDGPGRSQTSVKRFSSSVGVLCMYCTEAMRILYMYSVQNPVKLCIVYYIMYYSFGLQSSVLTEQTESIVQSKL